MWGVADAMAAGTPIRSIKACPGHDQGAIDAEVERICRDDALDEIQRPDGRILRRHSVQLPDGGRMLTYLDITDQRRALQAIEAAEQRQRRLLELAPFPLAVTRLSDGMVLYANARLEEITGVAAEQARGTFALDFYANPDDRRAHRRSPAPRRPRQGRRGADAAEHGRAPVLGAHQCGRRGLRGRAGPAVGASTTSPP